MKSNTREKFQYLILFNSAHNAIGSRKNDSFTAKQKAILQAKEIGLTLDLLEERKNHIFNLKKIMKIESFDRAIEKNSLYKKDMNFV